MSKNLIKKMTAIVFLICAIAITGCSGISEEQVAELESLRAEVKSLDNEIALLNNQKATLVKEISEKNSKLDDCAKLKTETQKNLDKLNR
jgi:chromosome segregation ATPase